MITTTPAALFPLPIRVKVTLYILVLLAVAASSFNRGVTSFVLASVAAAIAWLMVDSPRGLGWVIPKLFINFALMAAAFYLCYAVTAGGEFVNDSIILALGNFIIAIMVCKLFDSKTHRDFVQILVLSLLVVVAATMFSNALPASESILYAVVVAVYLGLLIYSLLLLNLRFENDAAVPKRPILVPAPERLVSLLRDLRRLVFRCLLSAAPLALAIFLMIPRARTSGFITSWGGGVYQTGFSETVQFHSYGQLAQSDAEVMHVTLSRIRNGIKENSGSELLDPYFRGQVLDTYSSEDRTWYHSGRPLEIPQEAMTADGVWLLKQDPRTFRDYEQQDYSLYAQAGHTLFFSKIPVWIYSEQVESVGVNRHDMTLSFSTRNTRFEYSVRTVPEVDASEFPEYPEGSIPVGQLRPALVRGSRSFDAAMVPAVVTNLALQILPEDIRPQPGQRVAPDKIRAAMAAFEGYLRVTYPYSLTFAQVDRNLDPTTDFLLNRKKTGGHCEYFASAMVFLCRAVGINARMVTGYHGGEYNSLANYYVVRQRDAHAWAEAWVPGSGWVTSDPSPISLNSDATPSALGKWTHQIVQLMEAEWLSNVVTFDNESRAAALGWISDKFSGFWDSDPVTALRLALSRHSSLSLPLRLAVLLPAGGLFLIVAWFWRQWRRRQERGDPFAPVNIRKPVKLSGDLSFLDELMRLFTRVSPRRPDLTPYEFIEQVAPASAAEEARWLVTAAYGLRFGTLSPTAELRAEIAAALHHVRISLRSASAAVTPSN